MSVWSCHLSPVSQLEPSDKILMTNNERAYAGLFLEPMLRQWFLSVLVALLMASAISVAAATDRFANDLQIEADRLAAVVSIVQKKARKSLVNTAQDRAFRRYFATDHSTNRRILRFHFDLILETLRDLRQMQEVALVGDDGDYIAQVKEEVVKQRDFEDRTSVFFFDEALAGPVRQAYTSSVHRLAGTDRWVVSYATPIVRNSEPVALLYYDQGIDAFQRNLDLLRRDDGIRRLAVSSDGRIIWDSTRGSEVSSDVDEASVGRDLPVLRLAGLPLSDVIDHVDQGVPIPDLPGSTLSIAYTKVMDWYLLSVFSVANEIIPTPSAALPTRGAAAQSAR